MLETPPKRVRAGFSLAVLTLVVVFGSLLLSALDRVHAYVPIILLGLALLGAALLLYGRRKTAASDVPVDRIEDKAAIENEHPLAFLGQSGYWGRIVIIAAVAVFVVCNFLMTPKKPIMPWPKAKRVAAKVAEPPAPAPEIKFPGLKLTGVVCNGTNSTAVLNGSTLGIGEGTENVTLVKVDPWGVIVEMNGVKKLISFED